MKWFDAGTKKMSVPSLGNFIKLIKLQCTGPWVSPRRRVNAAPTSANSRYVIEDLVTSTFENAPQMLDTPTPNRSGLRARLIEGSGILQQPDASHLLLSVTGSAR